MNNAIREWFDWRGWTVAGAAIVVVLGLMAILWPGFRSFVADPATAGWAAALGTFTAAVVSLYIALWARRANRLDAVTEGAFELVAAGYAVRQMEGQALLLQKRIAEKNAPIESPQQPSMLGDAWNEKFGPLAESLQAQIAQVSHAKIAAFCPTAGLAIVKAQAMFRRIEALSQSAAFRAPLADEVEAALTQLATVQADVGKAERHIFRIGAGRTYLDARLDAPRDAPLEDPRARPLSGPEHAPTLPQH
ncbi:hypothetical protein GG851_14935 [Bordetella petrii]|nr:hypothetical protein [Bordetella petrii]